MGESCVDKAKSIVNKNSRKVDNKVLGIILMLLNIFCPGLGTCLNACIGGDFVFEILILGGFEAGCAVFLFPWYMSIIQGIKIYELSK